MSDPDTLPPTPNGGTQRNRNPWKLATYCLTVALLGTFCGLIYSLTTSNDTEGKNSTPGSNPSIWEDPRSLDESSPISPGPSGEAPDGYEVGEKARSGGAVVTIVKVYESDTIPTVDGDKQKAGGEAKYVILEALVLNDAKQSMDLTCGLPIANALLDDDGRRYDTIDDLSEVEGNPECNAQLQPGFKDEMRFVYRVPADVKVTTWEFEEYDLEEDRKPSVIRLSKAIAEGA
ncbi:hypothetical protein GCM10012287_38140 [Streptomyces daqingensis]|uniref:DUF4352 domain-containing protein n=1 Tax=Streptomyces daqingensis TaxID=1472640 RepID=A0ABQ2MIQ0_9ACTN|nr:hypothetical protein [Streptomyces daqingensis]GGO52859.1 hypothetical protein GCM10012287_38140 [Streptomyces daqingensis]